MNIGKNLIFLVFSAYLVLLPQITIAEVVSQPIEALEIDAQADYHKGDGLKPAVLLIHGFLTTNKFHTITSISKYLQEEGFTTLAPTLTLDIANRQSSIKCNTIHTHTLEKDTQEIDDWYQWLISQGHKNIIVIGHSSGSPQLLEFLNQSKPDHINGAIFTSLFYMNTKKLNGQDPEIQHAKAQLALQNNRPHKYNFLFCRNNYFATPESYLSYLKLDRQTVLDHLTALKIPHYAVMGGADKRSDQVGGDWLTDLQETGTNMVVIDGANHFFSSEHEFELQDRLIEIIHELSQ